jgi:hypothetical protein
VPNTGPYRGKSKTKLARGGQSLSEKRGMFPFLLFQTYFCFSKSSKVANEAGSPTFSLEVVRKHRSLLPREQREKPVCFWSLQSPQRDERGIKGSHPCGITEVKMGGFIQTLQSSLRLEGLD